MIEALRSRDVPLSAVAGFGREALDRIHAAHILQLGAGGLGCASAQYLVAAGVGRFTLVDFDRVSESNLGRQVLYGPEDVGQAKVEVARRKLETQNPDVEVTAMDCRAAADFLDEHVPTATVVLDATDNFGTRLESNAACLRHGRRWIMGAAIRAEGQLMFRDPTAALPPCYRCAYGDAPERIEDCAGAGVLGPITGLIGSAMAAVALQTLAGAETISGLQLLDATTWTWRRVGVSRRPDCPACGGHDA